MFVSVFSVFLSEQNNAQNYSVYGILFHYSLIDSGCLFTCGRDSNGRTCTRAYIMQEYMYIYIYMYEISKVEFSLKYLVRKINHIRLC